MTHFVNFSNWQPRDHQVAGWSSPPQQIPPLFNIKLHKKNLWNAFIFIINTKIAKLYIKKCIIYNRKQRLKTKMTRTKSHWTCSHKLQNYTKKYWGFTKLTLSIPQFFSKKFCFLLFKITNCLYIYMHVSNYTIFAFVISL